MAKVSVKVRDLSESMGALGVLANMKWSSVVAKYDFAKTVRAANIEADSFGPVIGDAIEQHGGKVSSSGVIFETPAGAKAFREATREVMDREVELDIVKVKASKLPADVTPAIIAALYWCIEFDAVEDKPATAQEGPFA